jgi:hypothetical protein
LEFLFYTPSAVGLLPQVWREIARDDKLATASFLKHVHIIVEYGQVPFLHIRIVATIVRAIVSTGSPADFSINRVCETQLGRELSFRRLSVVS